MAWTERYVRADAAGGGAGTADNTTDAWTIAEAVSNHAAGHRINVRAGTYSNTTTTHTFATGGTYAAPVWIRGFVSTPGDLDGGGISGSQPLWTFTTGRLVLSGTDIIISNITLTSAATNSTLSLSGLRTFGKDLNVDNTHATHTGAAGVALWGGVITRSRINCDSTGGRAVTIGSAGGQVYDNRITSGNICIGIGHSGGRCIAGRNLIIDCGGDGIVVPFAATNLAVQSYFNNIFHAIGGNGINISNSSIGAPFHIHGNIFSDIGAYGINASGATYATVWRQFNAFYACTSGRETGFGDHLPYDEIILSADPFVDEANGNFNINNTAGGGALLRAAQLIL